MVVAALAATSVGARAETLHPPGDQRFVASPDPGAISQSPPPVLTAETARFAPVITPMAIDGRLDEASWSGARPVTRFFEIYPANVASPPAQTEARFLYDDEYVYIGVRAYDPNPAAIRAPLAKRDQMSADQDYAEIFIDTMNGRRSALIFRTNARGVAADAQFSEDTQARSLAPDFDFDVRTSRDEAGWSAEFRIPLATLRYRTGNDQAWAFVVFRGYPRSEFVRMASAPIPRGSNCQLCFAADIEGISLPRSSVPLSVAPQVAYSRNEAHSADTSSAQEHVRAGLDVRWQPRPDSIVDFTVKPDFSQVEADALQLTANARFALFLAEKRPFFLEGVDLLSSPIAALYTRSVTDPDFGSRLTHRGDGRDFTALAVRDAGGGSVIEPGPTASQIGAQDFESTALLSRYQQPMVHGTIGAIGSARFNQDGSRNAVFGTDAVWSPSSADRFVAQLLWSQTTNPNRPDLLPAWTGQHLAGGAMALSWAHRKESWYADFAHERFSDEFRAWNGFVPQVGVSSVRVGGGLNFYPDSPFLIRISPSVLHTRVDEVAGTQIDGSTSIGLQIDAVRSTSLSLTLLRDRELAPSGLESLDNASIQWSMNPVPWIPSIAIGASHGDGLDLATGEIGDQTTLSGSLRLRLFERCDLDASIAQLQLDSRRSGLPSTRLLTDTATQATAIWHFSSRLYTQLLHQRSRTTRTVQEASSVTEASSRTSFSSALLSFQANWRTRFFVGFSRGTSVSTGVVENTGTEAFAKFTYSFPMDESNPILQPFQRRAE